MRRERQYWIETVSKTYLYYRVEANSRRQALQKYRNGLEEYAGSNHSPYQHVRAVLTERPHISWR